MDFQIRELEQRASVDPEARVKLALCKCRIGDHTLQSDQIIENENEFQAHTDIGGCQCGHKVFIGSDLCAAGFHRWHPDYPIDGRFWCIRNQRHDAKRVLSSNPLIGPYGCPASLSGLEACQVGLHRKFRTSEGYFCLVEGCKWSEADPCQHEDGLLHQVDGLDVARCSECAEEFIELDICKIGHHHECRHTLMECYRPGCEKFVEGTLLHEALAQSYKSDGPGAAIAVRRGVMLARAEGWDPNLQTYGVRRPKAKTVVRNKKGFRLPRPASQVMVRMSRPLHPRFGVRFHMAVPYSHCTGKQKTEWAGCWYPVLEKKE